MNNSLNIKRIALLFKQYYFLNGNKLLLIIVATAGLISGYHLLIHAFNYKYLENQNFLSDYHISSFLVALIGACLLWCGNAFPDFRLREKRMSFLTNPTSSLEKFSFEVIHRIVLFVIVFPIIYWLFTNLVTGVFHIFVPKYENYVFNYSLLIPREFTNLEISLALSIGLLITTISFTGATYFMKLPVVKTIVFVFILASIFTGYIYFIVEGFNLKEYIPVNDRVLFIRNEQGAQITGIIAAIIGNIVLLLISYFKVKEKEV